MSGKISYQKLSSYLDAGGTQATIAALFGKTQPWVSNIKKNHPEATLVRLNGNITELKYKKDKSHKVVING